MLQDRVKDAQRRTIAYDPFHVGVDNLGLRFC
jgi:hypothetical protein